MMTATDWTPQDLEEGPLRRTALQLAKQPLRAGACKEGRTGEGKNLNFGLGK